MSPALVGDCRRVHGRRPGRSGGVRVGGYQTPAGDLVPALILTLGVGWSFSALGVVAAARWPGSRVGFLMVAVGLAWFARAIGALDARWAFEVAILTGALYLALLGHLVVTYPSGRLETRAQVIVVTAGYLCTVPLAVFVPMGASGWRDLLQCPFNLPVRATPRGRKVRRPHPASGRRHHRDCHWFWWRCAGGRDSGEQTSVAPALWGATAILAVLVVQRLGVLLRCASR